MGMKVLITLGGLSSVIIIFAAIFSPLLLIYEPENKPRSQVRFDKIEIHSNDDFKEKYDFPGKGTKTNPYIIDNRIINTNGTPGILIKQTTKYFIIRNCEIYSANYCIYLDNVYHGRAIIEDNICITLEPIRNDDSYKIGIKLKRASGTIIRNNKIISERGLFNYNRGILITHSDEVLILNNYISSYNRGLEISESSIQTIINNHFYNNTISIETVLTSNSTIIGNSFSRSEIAYYPHLSEQVELSLNSFTNNSHCMIAIRCNNFAIYRNEFSFNFRSGISSYEPRFFIVYENLFPNNSEYAILNSRGYNCYIYHNNFISNNLNGVFENILSQALSEPYTDYITYWFDPDTLEGNYWSDLYWTEDAIYLIDYQNDLFIEIDPNPLQESFDF